MASLTFHMQHVVLKQQTNTTQAYEKTGKRDKKNKETVSQSFQVVEISHIT